MVPAAADALPVGADDAGDVVEDEVAPEEVAEPVPLAPGIVAGGSVNSVLLVPTAELLLVSALDDIE